MDKAKRAEVLRQRFKAKGGRPYVPSGKPRQYRHTISGRPIIMAWPEAVKETRVGAVWARKVHREPGVTVRPKRNAGQSALSKIAQKAPKKLVKAYRDAEALLAERARQSRP
jgi:hypothetical protein